MCIGFNSLHQVPLAPELDEPRNDDESDYEAEWSGDEDGEREMDKGQNYPQGKRLWSWLVLCDDGMYTLPITTLKYCILKERDILN